MLDEEARAVQEVAKVTGKAIDLVRSAGGLLDDVFGETLRQLGGTAADWSRYFRLRNFLLIADKAKTVLDGRRITGKLLSIPPQFALPLLDGASLEAEEDIQQLWAGLIANAVDPGRAFRIKKVFLEILRGLEPLDARIMEFLSNTKLENQHTLLEDQHTILTGATLNVDVLATRLQVDPEESKISLQTLARYGCVIDAWESTLAGLDTGYSGFRVDNPKANFRLSHLGHQLLIATRTTL
ncbi:MAG: hypothetical protein JWN63_3047 [Candidatus Acidoferrum typicum]|nr:hypothetical protein [Candidatus Acidoferrum typicum]